MFLAPVESYIEIGSIQLDLASHFVRSTIKLSGKASISHIDFG